MGRISGDFKTKIGDVIDCVVCCSSLDPELLRLVDLGKPHKSHH